jgi:hypothetical protein
VKRFILALIIASLLLIPKPAYADGCNSAGCTYSGTVYTWWSWMTGFYVPCYYTYTAFYNGGYYYSDCQGSSSYLPFGY